MKRRRLRKAGRITGSILTGVFLLLVFVSGILHTSPVQSLIAKKVAAGVGEFMECKVQVSKMDFNLFKRTVTLRNVEIFDHKDNRCVFVGEAVVSLKNYNFSEPTLSLLSFYEPQIHIQRYVGDSMSDFKRVIRKIASQPKRDTALRKPFIIERGKIHNGSFSYHAWDEPEKRKDVIDFKHVELTNVYAEMKDFYNRIEVVMFEVEDVKCDEKTGFRLDDFASSVYIDAGVVHFNSARVKTPQSRVDLDFHLNGEDWGVYRDFINTVEIDADVKNSEVNLADLRHFTPVFGNMSQKVGVEGKVKGRVNNLDLKSLRLNMGKSTFINGDFSLAGLPKMKDGHLELKLADMNIGVEDLRNVVLPSGEILVLPEILQNIKWAKMSGAFVGGRDHFAVNLDIRTDVGNIQIGNAIRDTVAGFMSGNIHAEDLRLDKLFKKDSLFGKASVDLDFRLNGDDLANMLCHASGKVYRLEMDGKTLGNIPFDIDWSQKLFRIEASSADPNLDFSLDGEWEKKGDSTLLRGKADLRNLNLQALHLMGDTGLFCLKTRLVADHLACKGKSLQGSLRMSNTQIRRLGHRYRLDDLRMDLRQDSTDRVFRLRSKQADADMSGQWNLACLKQDFLKTLRHRLPHLGRHLAKNTLLNEKENASQDFDLRVNIRDADSLLNVLYPPLSLPLGLKLNLHYTSAAHQGNVQMALPYVQLGRVAYMDGDLSLAFNDESLQLNTNAEHLYLDDSLCMNAFSVKVNKDDTNTVRYLLSWGRDKDGKQHTRGKFAGLLHFLQGGGMRLELQDFRLRTGSAKWRSYSDGYVLFEPKRVQMHHVGMYALDASDYVSLEGEMSRDPASVLKMQFNDFNLSYLEFFLRKIPMRFDTKVEGEAELRDFYGDLSFAARLKLKDLRINRTFYGQGNFEASFDKNDVVRASLEVLRQESSQTARRGKTILSMSGFYYPKQQRRLDFKGYADDFPVNFLDEIMSVFATNLSGSVGGELRVGGTWRRPELYADAVCKNFAFSMPMLGTRYVFERAPLKLSSSEISFPLSSFSEALFKAGGRFSGKILHRNFKEVRLDLNIDFAKALALRTTRENNLPFWGTIFASGMLNISGPVEDLLLQLNAQSQSNSELFFDFSNTSGDNGAGFIAFKEAEVPVADSGRLSLEKYYMHHRGVAKRKGRITMDFNLDVTPELNVAVKLHNSAMDGLLSATGKGVLRYHMKNNIPQLFGTYTISGGGFDFSMVNLINKKFKLKEGSTVSWVGNASEPRVNARAGYQTKASLYPVLAAFDPANEGRYKQKSNVESIIALSGNLLNPDISFDIDLLNTDDDTQNKFWMLVRKNNEDEMLQQTFSLLMFNSFIAVQKGTSPSAGSSASVLSSELLFNQFNNFLSRFSNDINIGINYKPANTTGTSEFQVMMSGQLFDDRLVINGNLGVADDRAATAGNATTVVGDVDVEWKFTEELRLRGFNHSNGEDMTKPVNTYTQGVGIVFRRDFDNLREFLHGTTPRLTKEQKRLERKKNREIKQAKKSKEKAE